jgi:hypothetical protein
LEAIRDPANRGPRIDALHGDDEVNHADGWLVADETTKSVPSFPVPHRRVRIAVLTTLRSPAVVSVSDPANA